MRKPDQWWWKTNKNNDQIKKDKYIDSEIVTMTFKFILIDFISL